jgi:hypothetical protein
MRQFRYFTAGILFLAASTLMGQGFFDLTYNVAFPMGNTRDFISKTSWRGFSLEGGVYLTKHIAVGANFTWNGFYETFPYQTYSSGTISITGNMWRYTNSYPLMATAKYFFLPDKKFQVYGGIGIGTIYVNKQTDLGVFTASKQSWLFGFYPEVGGTYWFNNQTGILFNTRYAISTTSQDVPGQSYLGLNLGIIWKLGKGEFNF